MRISQVLHVALSILILAAVTSPAQAQSTTSPAEERPAKAVGTLVYFEGDVKITHSGQDWSTAQVDQFLRPTHTLRTGANASAEIRWSDGTSTVVGPESTQPVAALYERAKKKVNSPEERGVVQRFVDLFAEDRESTNDPGGIRRGQPTVSFSEVARTYQSEHYRKAVRKLHLFLEQNPLSPKAKKVRFALGLCYLKLNNPLQAEAEFKTVLQNYPDHALADQAQNILDTL